MRNGPDADLNIARVIGHVQPGQGVVDGMIIGIEIVHVLLDPADGRESLAGEGIMVAPVRHLRDHGRGQAGLEAVGPHYVRKRPGDVPVGRGTRIGGRADIEVQGSVTVVVPGHHVEIEHRHDVVARVPRGTGVGGAAQHALLFAGEQNEPESALERMVFHDSRGGHHGDAAAGVVVRPRRIAAGGHVVDVGAEHHDFGGARSSWPDADHVAVGGTAGGPVVIARLQAQRRELFENQRRRPPERRAGVLVPRPDRGVGAVGHDRLDARQFGQSHIQIGLQHLRHHGGNRRVAGDGRHPTPGRPRGFPEQRQVQGFRRQLPALEAQPGQFLQLVAGGSADDQAAAVVVDHLEFPGGGRPGSRTEFKCQNMAGGCHVCIEHRAGQTRCGQFRGRGLDQHVTLSGGVLQPGVNRQGKRSRQFRQIDAHQ